MVGENQCKLGIYTHFQTILLKPLVVNKIGSLRYGHKVKIAFLTCKDKL